MKQHPPKRRCEKKLLRGTRARGQKKLGTQIKARVREARDLVPPRAKGVKDCNRVLLKQRKTQRENRKGVRKRRGKISLLTSALTEGRKGGSRIAGRPTLERGRQSRGF